MATTAQSNSVRELSKVEQIARLNDELRTKGIGGQILVTRGVHALTGAQVSELLRAVSEFNNFNPDGDSHGEHDFGTFEFCGAQLMWKIDYYSREDAHFGSDDPTNPDMTLRVLTIFLAEEY